MCKSGIGNTDNNKRPETERKTRGLSTGRRRRWRSGGRRHGLVQADQRVQLAEVGAGERQAGATGRRAGRAAARRRRRGGGGAAGALPPQQARYGQRVALGAEQQPRRLLVGRVVLVEQL